jgi:hypothetical protein
MLSRHNGERAWRVGFPQAPSTWDNVLAET